MPSPTSLLYLLAVGGLGLFFVSALPLVDEASTSISSAATNIIVVPVAAETDANIVGAADLATMSNSSLSHTAVSKVSVPADPISKYTVGVSSLFHAHGSS